MEICVHCDEMAPVPLQYEGLTFCCEGCHTVHTILHSKGLEAYYEIKKNSSTFRRRSPVELKETKFEYLDSEEFLKDFSWTPVQDQKAMEFYLEGIHCLACLWLIEKLPEFVPSLLSSKLDLERSVVTVILEGTGKFSSAARELSQLGYRPHPLKKNQETQNLKLKEDRMALLRIGIAGAAAGNIMIYAVSLYGGAQDEFARLFNLLTVVFGVPALTFSAWPFYKNAWSALKNRTLSIDIPISLSIVVGIVMGLYNLWAGINDNYFDSLTALVFLLSLSRYFLQKIQEKGLAASDLHYFYQTDSVELENGQVVHPRFLKSGDVIKLGPNEITPADGVITKGRSHFNNSILTGESRPVLCEAGTAVFAGTQNLGETIFVKVTEASADSRLGRILKNVEHGQALRSHIVQLTNKVSKYFTMAVFALSAILFAYLLQKAGLKHALEGAITLLIVTCPCALALAVPLTFTRALSKASQNGIIIKSDEVLERIAQVDVVLIDKTGTLTYGVLKVSGQKNHFKTSVPLQDVIFSLEKNVQHPVARALIDSVRPLGPEARPVTNFMQQLGIGVSGQIDGHTYEINRNGIFEDGKLASTFTVEDLIREDSAPTLKKLQRSNKTFTVLSGDDSAVVQKLARELDLPAERALSGIGPEEKGRIIVEHPKAMMVGDGANDAIALSRAHVGVAVMGAMDVSLRAADVYLTTPGLRPVEQLFVLSKETMKVVRRNLVLSLCYNSLSVVAAFTGLINPLVAAIIMPLSSLTVLLSTLAGTKELRALWK